MSARKQYRSINGIAHQKCIGELHNGEWLPLSQFPSTSYKLKSGGSKSILMPRCKRCRSIRMSRERYPHVLHPGRVPLASMQNWLWEIVQRCNSISAAADTLGIHRPTMFRWMNRYKGYHQTTITRTKALHIILTLRGLRDGTITPSPGRRTKNRFKYGCASCGTPLDTYTPGCGTCVDRRATRARRDKAA